MKLLLSVLLFFLLSICRAQIPLECDIPIGPAYENQCVQSEFPDTVSVGSFAIECFYFKPVPEPCFHLSFLLISGVGCGPLAYNQLSFEIYDENCDSLISSGTIYPTQSNTFQCLDSTKTYIICYRFRPRCNIYSACPIITSSGLPVDWLFFRGFLEEKRIMLRWATASEENADYFEVQKLDSCFNFKPLVKIKAHGSTTIPHSYEYSDKEIKDHNYYRIKQVDYNGEFNYSEIIVINAFPRAINTNCSYYNVLGAFMGYDSEELPRGNIYIRICKDSYKGEVIYK